MRSGPYRGRTSWPRRSRAGRDQALQGERSPLRRRRGGISSRPRRREHWRMVTSARRRSRQSPRRLRRPGGPRAPGLRARGDEHQVAGAGSDRVHGDELVAARLRGLDVQELEVGEPRRLHRRDRACRLTRQSCMAFSLSERAAEAHALVEVVPGDDRVDGRLDPVDRHHQVLDHDGELLRRVGPPLAQHRRRPPHQRHGARPSPTWRCGRRSGRAAARRPPSARAGAGRRRAPPGGRPAAARRPRTGRSCSRGRTAGCPSAAA